VTWLNACAYHKGAPQVIKPPTFPSGIPIHFYDIETAQDTVYLHGDIRVFGKERDIKQFLATDPSEEERAWNEFLDYLAQDKEAVIYCWADYERGFAKSLWEKYGGNKKGWKHLERNLVDQCKFVRDHFAMPVHSYGIKNVAPVFGFSWSDDDAGGLNSEAWFEEWLRTHNEEILDKILRYNLDDILAMEVIDSKLKEMVTVKNG
jgi:predicted RecB family nuclease